MTIHRFVMRCRPAANNRSYHRWQSALLVFFVAQESKPAALQELLRLLAQHRWTLIETLERSTLIEERVREAGGEVWAAYERAGQRGYWMRPRRLRGGRPPRPPRTAAEPGVGEPESFEHQNSSPGRVGLTRAVYG